MKQSSPTLCQEHLCSFAVLARTNIHSHSTGHRRLQTPVLCKLALKEKGNLTAAEKTASPLLPQPHHLLGTSFATQMLHLGVRKPPSQAQTLCIWTFQTLSNGYVESLTSLLREHRTAGRRLCVGGTLRDAPVGSSMSNRKQECYIYLGEPVHGGGNEAWLACSPGEGTAKTSYFQPPTRRAENSSSIQMNQEDKRMQRKSDLCLENENRPLSLFAWHLAPKFQATTLQNVSDRVH